MVNLKTLSKKVKGVVGDNLISMMVFGSYARGDHNDDSDVDLIVVVKDKNKQLIDRLNQLEYDLSIKDDGWVDEKSSKFLNFVGFKKSIFLFDLQEFRQQRFNFCDSQFLAWLLIPKGIIWSNIKREGKVVMGKNLLNFKSKVSLWDKIKAPMPGVGACLFASVLFLFNRDRAIQLAQTGLRWTYMNVKGVLQRSKIDSIFGNLVEIFKITFSANYA